MAKPPTPHGRGAQRRAQARKRQQPQWLWIGLGAAVVLAALVAVVATRGGSDSRTTTESGLEQVRPVTVAGSALPTLPSSGADPAVGSTAPTLTGQSFDGSAVKIEPDGKAKIVLFVAHWCPHCQAEIPRIVDHLETNPLPSDVALYAVSTGVSDAQPNYPPSRWLREQRFPAPVLADDAASSAGAAYGLSSFPYFVAVDGAGKVVSRATGEISMSDFQSLVDRLATG